ncbi:restriction endonuclease subunit S [Thermodesulfobacteriota bacterium]
MELREGYKQTEVGIIPVDWDEVKFGNIIDYTKGFAFKSKDYVSYGTRIIRVSDTTFDSIKEENQIYVDNKEDKHYSKWMLFENDLIFSTVGSKPPMYDSMVGKVILIPKNHEGSLLNQNAVLIRSKNKTASKQKFLLHHFRTKRYLNYIEKIFRGNANQASITLDELFKFAIPLPPTNVEQTAIATALSDADALIQSLTTLIAKKRNIKQGTMQELLKPKKGWVAKKLGRVCWFQEGPGVRNFQFTSSGVKLLNGTNIENGKLLLDKTDRYISEKEAFGCYSHFLVDANDIVIACSGITVDRFHEKVTVVNEVHLPLCMNTSTMRFKVISKKISKDYFFHFLKSISFKKQIGGQATGSAQLNFGPSHVEKVSIWLPKLEEQTHIATILSDMDAEITTLENKLDKYRQIKQGMMQELLTGKTRLI